MPVQGVDGGGWQGQQPVEGTSGPKGASRSFEGGQKPSNNTVADAKKAFDEILDDVVAKKGLEAGKLFNLQLRLQLVLQDEIKSNRRKFMFCNMHS